MWAVAQSVVLTEQMAAPPQEVPAGLKGLSPALPVKKKKKREKKDVRE